MSTYDEAIAARQRTSGHVVSDLMLWFSLIQSVFICLACAVLTLIAGVCVWNDLLYSVTPMRRAKIIEPVNWFLSILSSVTELFVGLNTDIGKAFTKNLPQIDLPYVSKRQFYLIIKTNWLMLAYDIVTNIIGAWMATSPIDGDLEHLAVALFITIVLTLSELFFIFFLSLTLVSGQKAQENIRRLRAYS